MALEEMGWHPERRESRIRAVPYRIHSSSSYSKEFTPVKVIANKPEDHTSRWSCQAGDTQPWLLLELIKPAVLHQVTIGKYKEDHPCNPQSLRILAGDDPSHLEEVLDINLKNDSTPETADLRHNALVWKGDMAAGNLWDLGKERSVIPFAVRYVKILPGRAYEPRYNVSLWHIKLAGIIDAADVEKVQRHWSQAQKLQKDRLVLKHLRYSPDLRPAFQNVLRLMQASHKISTVYEHPTITRLFEELVLNRNYVASEEILLKMYEQDLMKGYDGLVPKRYSWKTLHDSSMQPPSIRGGHAMCAHDGTVWLFGGSDGKVHLNDFWRGSLDAESLSWIEVERRSDIWPELRGRYLMIAASEYVYMISCTESKRTVISRNQSFGLVVDDLVEAVASAEKSSQAEAVRTESLWQYDIGSDEWRMISQLSIDDADESLSSLNWHEGELIVGRTGGHSYGLSRYHVQSNTWRHDRTEFPPLSPFPDKKTCPHEATVFTEFFDPVNMRQVIITPRILSDSHDSADECLRIESVPPPDQLNMDNTSQCFINLDGTALILLTGKSSDCLIPSEDKQTLILAYSISQGEWQELQMDDVVYPGNSEPPQVDNREYRVRKCGHEMAYDRVSGRCLLYGGRTDEHGLQGNQAAELVLHSVRQVDVLRKCRRSIRREGFFDILYSRSSLEALAFLQDSLSEVTDPFDVEEQRDLKVLFTSLLRQTEPTVGSVDQDNRDRDGSLLTAFQEILQYVSTRYKEPVDEIKSNMHL